MIAQPIGAKTRLGLGGFNTAEAALSALTGVNNADFTIDNISTFCPAAGAYNGAWAPAGGPVWTLTGASSQVYQVTSQANAFHVATRNGAPTHADSNNDPDRTQLYLTLRRSTAAGGPALGDSIIWRDTAQYNPTNALWYLEPLGVAAYTGGPGRITITSQTVNTGLDANGNPIRGGLAQMGMVYFSPDNDAPYPIDFRGITFYTNEPTPPVGIFFQYAQGSGVSFYDIRAALGPAVLVPNNQGGFRLTGACTFTRGHFVGMGDPACVTMDTRLAGPAEISDTILEGIYSDGFGFVGSNVAILRNFGFGWLNSPGNHQDPVQTGNAATIVLGEHAYNIFHNDLGGNLQSGFFLADQVAGFLASANFHNNILSLGNNHGYSLDKPDAPVGQFNTILCDPLVNPLALIDTAIELFAGGQNGAVLTGNICNAVSSALQPGVVVLDNLLVPVGALTSAQLIARYQQIFPNYPANNTDPRWRNRAGSLNIWTPADLAVASGGAKKLGGTFYGSLFPAPAGYPNGPWNDGSVYDPLNPVWLAAHPAAT